MDNQVSVKVSYINEITKPTILIADDEGEVKESYQVRKLTNV